MANSNKQTELKSTEEANSKMRRSFSWDRAFFTSDGFLADDELSSMIEGDGDDVKQELDKVKEVESLEAKLFQEIEVSTPKSTGTLSSGKKGSQPKKMPIKTSPTRPSLLSGGSPVNSVKTPPRRNMSPKTVKANTDSPANNVKTPPRRNMSPKTGKANADSPSKTPPGITTKNRNSSVSTRVSRTSPASPVSPGSSGSSSSTVSTVNQRLKKSGSVSRRSSVSNEKPSLTNARRNDDLKSSKPAVDLMPKSQSSISLKIKPAPVISQPTSPSRLSNSSSGSTTRRLSESSSSSTSTVNQKSITKRYPTLKNHPTGHTSDLHAKQQPTTCRTGSPDGSNAKKLPSIKTVAAANTGLKPKSPKTATKKQSRGAENIHIISPEVLDLKGKINALRMEISMQKERCNKMVRAGSGVANLKTPFAIQECSL